MDKAAEKTRWDNQCYPPPPATLDQIECEVEAIHLRTKDLSARLEIDEKQAFWAMTSLYLEAIRLGLK